MLVWTSSFLKKTIFLTYLTLNFREKQGEIWYLWSRNNLRSIVLVTLKRTEFVGVSRSLNYRLVSMQLVCGCISIWVDSNWCEFYSQIHNGRPVAQFYTYLEEWFSSFYILHPTNRFIKEPGSHHDNNRVPTFMSSLEANMRIECSQCIAMQSLTSPSQGCPTKSGAATGSTLCSDVAVRSG